MENCLQGKIQGYIDQLESLSLDNVEQLHDYVAEDIVFSDPFNKVSGAKNYIGLLVEMFDKLDNVKFIVYESLYQEKVQLKDSKEGNPKSNNVAYLYWNFSASSRSTGKLNFDGSSRLVFNQDGKIGSHQDFWDGLVTLNKIPLLGAILRWLKNRISYQKN